jgi:hypothetical protein
MYQQDIAAVADEAAQKYKEDTAPEALTEGGPTAAMLEAVKVKTQNLVSRLSKLTAVANPTLGREFLEEVHIHHLTLWTLNAICSILLSAHILIDRTDSEALEYEFFPRDDLGEIANDCHCKCGSKYQVSLIQAIELKFPQP